MKIQSKRIFAIAILTAAIAAQAQDSNSNPNPGISAFNEGRYDEALTQFEQQEREGMSTDALQYNIAVSLYRLQRYDQAKARFLNLVDKAQWRVLVQYNLGLLAQAQGEREEALRYFRAGTQQQENERVATLAQSKLAELENVASAASPPTTAKRFSSVISLSAGDDSNATSLANDLLDTNSNASDTFHELLLYGQYQISGTSRDGFNVYGLGFDRAFNEFSRLDSRVIGAGLGFAKPVGNYQFETGLRLTRTSLDSEEVADQTQVSLGVSRQWSFGTLNLDLRASRFGAAAPYQQIDGDQQQLELGWRKRLGDFTFKTRYRYEENDRQDLQRGGAFASYSPTRHALRAEMRWQASATLSTGFAAEYIDSQYDGVNRLREVDGSIKQAQRQGEQRRLSADIAYRLSANWLLRAQYQLTDQRDNFDIYQYDKHRVLGSVEFQY